MQLSHSRSFNDQYEEISLDEGTHFFLMMTVLLLRDFPKCDDQQECVCGIIA